jgi:hypothetical protein
MRTQMKIDLLFSQKEVPPREMLLAICLNAVNELGVVRLLQALNTSYATGDFAGGLLISVRVQTAHEHACARPCPTVSTRFVHCSITTHNLALISVAHTADDTRVKVAH